MTKSKKKKPQKAEYKITPLDLGRFEVKNETKGTTYIVDAIKKECKDIKGEFCKAFMFSNEHKCKHLRMCEGIQETKDDKKTTKHLNTSTA